MLASPFGVIPRRKLTDNAVEIAGIARSNQVGGLVVGLPLSMDGSFGPAAQRRARLGARSGGEHGTAHRDVG